MIQQLIIVGTIAQMKITLMSDSLFKTFNIIKNLKLTKNMVILQNKLFIELLYDNNKIKIVTNILKNTMY